jgi:hypothetical protein
MARKIRHKNYRIDVAKLNRARRVLGTCTETETIHRALDMVADEVELARALKGLLQLGPGSIVDIHTKR